MKPYCRSIEPLIISDKELYTTMTKAKGTSKTTHRPIKTNSHRSRPREASAEKGLSASLDPTSASICPVQKRCGGCQLLSLPYEEQLSRKQAEIHMLFDELSNRSTEFCPIAGMDEPYYYRNKVTSPYVLGKKLPAKGTQSNSGSVKKSFNKKRPARYEILCGMYAQGTHKIVPTDECLLENRTAKKVILTIKQLMQRYHMEPYNEDKGTGFLRHAIVRVGHTSGEMLVTLVTNKPEFSGSKNFCHELVKRVPEVTTIVQNINTRITNAILGQDEKTLYGPGFILDELCGLSFRISSHSFYQVNSTQTEVLYRKAIEMAQLTGKETVLDAYCGTGTIGLVAAKGLPDNPHAHAAKVIGVDNIGSAIKDARNNAKHNGLDNANFVTDDAGRFMVEQSHSGLDVDTLIMDPPRAGASLDFLKATCTLDPYRIVYISCNPKTQKRDVSFLLKHGYVLTRVQPVDMFPHTEHTENICLLVKKQ